MDPEITARERLASDLELLGILGDPKRGPLAHLYEPPRPQIDRPAPRVRPRTPWPRTLAVAMTIGGRLRAAIPALVTHLAKPRTANSTR